MKTCHAGGRTLEREPAYPLVLPTKPRANPEQSGEPRQPFTYGPCLPELDGRQPDRLTQLMAVPTARLVLLERSDDDRVPVGGSWRAVDESLGHRRRTATAVAD